MFREVPCAKFTHQALCTKHHARALGFPCHRVTKYAPTSLALAQRGGSHCVAHRSTIARLPSGAAAKRSAASAQGRSAGGRVLRHVGTFAVSAPLRSSLRHREPPFLPCAAFIRECGLHGLVGIPPVTLQGRLAAPVASRRRIGSGPVAEVPRPLRADGTCSLSRRASRGHQHLVRSSRTRHHAPGTS